MGDRVDEITVKLQTHPTPKTAAEVRRNLNQLFSQLDADESARLLDKILTFEKLKESRVPHDFRVLNRHARLELLLKLVVQLGTQRREALHKRLIGHDVDPKLQKGLRYVFPEGTEEQRGKFLEALKHVPTTNSIPVITLKFRGQGHTSPDNNCKVRRDGIMPEVLGPNPAGNDVWIEIQGLVKGHHPKAEYRFDRTIESLILFLHNNKWRSIPDFYKAPGTPDNKDRDDEDTKPDNDHIYVVDGPGLGDPPVDRLRGIDDIKRITQCVKIMNATESLKVKVGNSSWNTVISAFDWFVIIWLERDKNGAWQMNVKKSGAAPGSAGPLFPLKDGGFEPPAFNN